MSAPDDAQRGRQQTRELIERLQRDPAFRREVAANPEQTLRATGVSQELMTDVASAFGVAPEVMGYMTRWPGDLVI